VLWDQVLLPWQAAHSDATLLHASAGTMPFIRTLPTVVTVHDLAWHRVQSHTRAYARTYFGTLQARAYRHAAAIVCDSQFSANEYNELIDPNAHIDVVYPGVDERFSRIVRKPDESPFALVVGTVETRKNLGVLVDALTAIPSLRIVSTGPHTPYADDVRMRAVSAGVSNRLELRGYVTRDELDDLYARAACALIPSRYEGFGYALAEAMCAGVPAIAASSSSLIEVANGSVPLIPPDDANAWTEAVRSLLADRPKAESNATALRLSAQHRFSWPTAAANVRRIYDRIAAR
jgi:glycosyltransferase involved in cell wall biosynthesis